MVGRETGPGSTWAASNQTLSYTEWNLSPLLNLPLFRPLHANHLVAVEQAERIQRLLDLLGRSISQVAVGKEGQEKEKKEEERKKKKKERKEKERKEKERKRKENKIK